MQMRRFDGYARVVYVDIPTRSGLNSADGRMRIVSFAVSLRTNCSRFSGGNAMHLRITAASFTLAFALVAICPAYATQSAAASPFVPPAFNVPKLVETRGFKIVPLGPELVKIDFAAYMSSIEHLQQTFTRSTDWPHKGISDADAMRDMETEQARFNRRESFAYAVLTPDGSRERGCVYVSPSPVAGYDAVVRIWVTKAEYEAGFDAELYKWTVKWAAAKWPFKRIAYPGRAIEWPVWDALVAAKAKNKP